MSGWKAGTASQIFTPDEPMWLAGYAARTEPAKGKVSDLRAKALALEDANGARLLILTVDLIAVQLGPTAAGVAEHLHHRHGLPRERIVMAASHTHYGPEIRPDKALFFGIPAEFAQKIDDAAVPGFRIAVTRGSLGVDTLAVRLPRAELVQVDSAAAGLEALRRGDVQLLASDRPNLLVLAQSFAGSRVLEDRYHTFRLAIAVPKGESAWLQYIDEFLAEARKTRVIEGAIQRAKLRGVQ